MNAARLVMQTEASSLLLLDRETGELCVSIPTGPVKDQISGMSIPANKGVGGWIIAKNASLYINDVSSSKIFWKDLSPDFKTKNLIGVPLQDSDGMPFGVLQAINKKGEKEFDQDDVEIFEALALHVSQAIIRSREYEVQKGKMDEREVQITEIHHRLKNNLAAISAMIELDMEDLEEPLLRNKFASVISRIKSVAEAHMLLYDQDNLEQLDLSEYLKAVIDNVDNIFQQPNKSIDISINLENVWLNSSRAMLCGLIVNEMMINAFKHAFGNRNEGRITVNLKKTSSDKITIIVTDDGIGQSEFSDIDHSKISGTFIIQALAKKLKAEIQTKSEPNIGSTYIVSFHI